MMLDGILVLFYHFYNRITKKKLKFKKILSLNLKFFN